jgi:hypothetical protein
LGAVAFLGANLPAVTTLSDILAWYSSDKQVMDWFASDNSEIDVFEIDHSMEGVDNMTEELKALLDRLNAQEAELNTRKAAFEAEVEAFSAKSADVLTKESTLASRAARLDKFEAVLGNVEDADALEAFIRQADKERAETAAKKELYDREIQRSKAAEVTSVVDALLTDSKIVPAQADLLRGILSFAQDAGTTLKFSKDVADKLKLKAEVSYFEAVKEFCNSLPSRKLLEEFTASGNVRPENITAERRKMVDEYKTNHKCSYAKAQVAVSKLRPDLFED